MRTLSEVLEPFGYVRPDFKQLLDRFNGAIHEYEAFLERKQERIRVYAQRRDADDIAVERGNYEIAKSLEFSDIFADVVLDIYLEAERECIYQFEVQMFGKQTLHGKELQAEINRLKLECGV